MAVAGQYVVDCRTILVKKSRGDFAPQETKDSTSKKSAGRRRDKGGGYSNKKRGAGGSTEGETY